MSDSLHARLLASRGLRIMVIIIYILNTKIKGLAKRRSACAALNSFTIRFLYKDNTGMRVLEGGWEGVVHLVGGGHTNILLPRVLNNFLDVSESVVR